MAFSAAIKENYRVVRTQHGVGEQDAEYTIPLGSWRKGGGLAGKLGHVYEHGPGSAGIWLNGRQSKSKLEALRADFPDLKIMQVGGMETTAKVPMSCLEAILPALNAKRRFKASSALLAAAEKGRLASPIAKKQSGSGRATE
jgi:hypothetical protein